MRIDAHNESVLRPDFAPRVIERIRKAKRRRRLHGWVLTSTGAGMLAIAAILYFRPVNLPPPLLTRAASHNQSHSEWVSPGMELNAVTSFNSRSLGQPLAFFFPGATAVADFQSSQASCWHSYDPWWDPNSNYR